MQVTNIAILLVLLFNPLLANAGDINQDLIEAAKKGDTAAVQALLEASPDVYTKDKDDATPLILAAYYGHTDVVQLLKKAAEADIFSKVTGKWSWSNAKSPCVEDFHTIRFLENNSVAEFTDSEPYTYTVLGHSDDRILMFLDSKTQKTDDGQLVKWELILYSADVYFWRRTDWDENVYTRRILRCPTAAVEQFRLAQKYFKGEGLPKDYAQAAKWLRKAAEQGFAVAQTNLGAMYADGQGVSKDYAEALKWYRKAAGQGHAVAQTNLGTMYANGQKACARTTARRLSGTARRLSKGWL